MRGAGKPTTRADTPRQRAVRASLDAQGDEPHEGDVPGADEGSDD